MKKYNVEISGIEMSIMSDEGDKYVENTISKLNTRISDIQISNKRCTKMEAIIMAALEFLDEKQKLEKELKRANNPYDDN